MLKCTSNQFFLIRCGLTPYEANRLLQMFDAWIKNNGVEWANSRWKDLRQWYETYLTGKPVPPSWWAHTRKGMPSHPIIRKIFGLKRRKALLALSINTQLLWRNPVQPFLPSQLEKSNKGFEGNGFVLTDSIAEEIRQRFSVIADARLHPEFHPELRMVDVHDFLDAAASTFAVADGRVIHNSGRDETERQQLAAEAWLLTVDSVPQLVRDFYISRGEYQLLPFLGRLKAEIQTQNPKRAKYLARQGLQFSPSASQKCVGAIGYVQEEQLKLRRVANGHRATQVALEPLADLLYGTLRNIGYGTDGTRRNTKWRDCTYSQESGVEWVRAKLAEGTTLAGCDLTSATDLISLESSFIVLETVFFPDLKDRKDFQQFLKLYQSVARGQWRDSADGEIKYWKQGQPMGLEVSFPTLGLVNAACARLACVETHAKHPEVSGDDWATIGDDVILAAEAVETYKDLMTRLFGAEINLSKTLTSSEVAEFGGRVIFRDFYCNKATKLPYQLKMRDDQFLPIMSRLGDEFKPLLTNEQAEVWEQFRFAPGVILGDPWPNESLGEPLTTRYAWFLDQIAQHIEVKQDRCLEVEPTSWLWKSLLRLGTFPGSYGRASSSTELLRFPGPVKQVRSKLWRRFATPITSSENETLGYLPKDVLARPHGDPWFWNPNLQKFVHPRRKKFKSFVTVGLKLIRSSSFVPYGEYKTSYSDRNKRLCIQESL